MASGQEDLNKAARLPEGDVIAILLRQHARVRELFSDIEAAEGEHKQHAFDELRALLAVHETAEEMVLRPISRKTAGEATVNARNDEEREATEVLAQLEQMGAAAAGFDEMLATLKSMVTSHAEHEESEEFPSVLNARSEEERQKLGSAIRAAEQIAPTHPHPSAAGSPAAQYTVGPFAALVDRTRDAISQASS